MEFNSNYNAEYIGGILGEAFYDVSLTSLNLLTELSVNKVIDLANPTIPINPRSISYVGGIIGHNDDSNFRGQLTNTDVTLSGQFESHVGGFIGLDGYSSKLFLDNFDVNFNIEFDRIVSSSSGDGNYFGGLIGQTDEELTLIANDIFTEGLIKGLNYLGGLIGYIDEQALIRIDNSINEINIVGSHYLGGFIGSTAQTEDNDFNLIYINDSTNNGSFTPVTENLNQSDNSMEYVGGFIGYFNDYDFEDFYDLDRAVIVNQLWINSSLSTTDINLTFSNTEQVESVDISNIGGLVGELDDSVFFRASNNVINLNISSNISNRELTGQDFDASQLGGVVGQVEEYVNVQLVNNDVTFDFTSFYSNNTGFIDSSPISTGFEIYEVGGSIGTVNDNSLIIDLENIYNFDMEVLIQDNDFSNIDFDFEIDNIGGYGGYFDYDSTIIIDTIDIDFIFDLVIENTTVSLVDPLDTESNSHNSDINIYVSNVGSFFGGFYGIGLIGKFEITIVDTVDLDDVASGVTITVTINQSNIGDFTGTRNPFILSPIENLV
jgi:hypothetical protein